MIDRDESRAFPSEIFNARWDRELAAWRVPADQLSGLRVRLTDTNVRYSDEVHPPLLNGAWSFPELRWYQREAIDAWAAAGHRGVLALPTGSGKTLAAIAAIAKLGVATLVLVPTRVLLDQWARALEAAWPHPIGRLGDGDHRVAPITICTYASAIVWAPRIGDRFGLVVVDEAHHVGAWCPREILEMLVAPARLGLTATPPVGPSSSAGASAVALEQHVGPVVYARSISDLAGDALAPFDITTIPITLAPDERASYHRQRAKFGATYAAFQRASPGASWKEYVAAASRTRNGREGLAAWRKSRAVLAYPVGKQAALREILERHTGDRILIFTADNTTAYAIARELLVMPITCDIGRAERTRMLDRFRSGEASVLVSSQVLDEGLDVPDAEVAIIIGGTASERRHVQRIGRVLRPRPGKRARVYELVAEATSELSQQVTRRRGLRGSEEPAFA